MNTNVRISLAAAAALLAIAPVAASAQQTAYAEAPIAIRAVTNQQNFFTVPYGAQRFYTDGLAVRFENAESVVATRVEFAVDRDGTMQRYTARGTYAPGTSVTAELNRDVTEQPQADATVTISKVDFADGTSWTPETGRVASTATARTAAR